MLTFLLRATLLVVLFPILTVQSQNPIWGKLFDTERGSICIETATSPDGFLFAFGYYGADLDLGIKTLHPKYDNSGSFIIKMDRDGDVVDAFPVDGRGVAIENGKIDLEGNIIVCGRFFGSIEFNGVEITDESPTAFVAKYSPVGTPLWVKVVSTGNYSNIALDESNNVFFVTTKNYDFYNTGSLLYKYDPDGNLIFENEFLDQDDNMAYVRSIDVQNGEAIVAGMVDGSGTIFDNLHYDRDWWGFYVAKFNTDGSIKWTTNIGQTSYNNADCSDIVYAADGGFFLAGGLPDNSLLIRYNVNGQELWAKKSFPQSFTGSYLAWALDGNLFLATDFYDGAEIDGIALRATPDSNVIVNAPNFALIKMDPQGKILGLQQAEPGVINDLESITIGIFGEVYVGGWSDSSPIQVGSVQMNSVKDGGLRHADGFVMRFDDAPGNYIGFTITTAEVCVNTPNQFSTDLNTAEIKTISWDFGDPSGTGNTSSQLSPSHQYKNPGVYKVIATVTDVNNEKRYASLIFNVHGKMLIFLGDDFALCPGEEKLIGVEPHANWTFEWQDGSTQNVFSASVAGEYRLTVSDAYCTSSDTLVVTALHPPPDLDLHDQTLCRGKSFVVDLSMVPCNISWSDGDNNQKKTINTAGTYTVTATNSCGDVTQTFKVDIAPTLEVNIPNHQLCKDQVYTVDLGSVDADLRWNDGDKAKTKTFSTPGAYSVVLSNACESKTIAFTLDSVEPLHVDLGGNQLLSCAGGPIILSAGKGVASRVWSDGSTASTLNIAQSGTYWIEVSNECETVRDSIEITSATSEMVFLPNVITPNGDPHNEYFILDEKIAHTPLSIFNRWGERVYESTAYGNDWNGGSLENAVYYYILPEYCLKGWIQIIR